MIPLSFDPAHFEVATSVAQDDTIISINPPSMTNWNIRHFRKSSRLLQLPNELILLISSFLDHHDLCRIRRQNRQLHLLLTPELVRWMLTPYPRRWPPDYKTSLLYRAVARPEEKRTRQVRSHASRLRLRLEPAEDVWLTGRILSQCTPEQLRVLSHLTHGVGFTLVARAAAGCRLEILELLHKYGLDMTVPFRGWTPLHLVILRWNKPRYRLMVEKIIALLISAGADLEAVSEEGYTPLQLAVYRNNVGATEALVRAGADAWSTGKHKKGLNSVELARLVRRTTEIRQLFQELVFPGVKMLFSPRIRNRGYQVRREAMLLALEADKGWDAFMY